MNKTALIELIKQLTDPDRFARNSAAESLGQAAEFWSAEALCMAIADPDRGVRSGAAWALGRALNKELDAPLNLSDAGVMVLINALRDKGNERFVRRVAAVALGRTGDVRAVAPLCSTLNEVDTSVFAAASESMAAIGDACILPLCAALQDANSTIHIRAEVTLARICRSTNRLAHRILGSTTLSGSQMLDTLLTLKHMPRIVYGSLVADLPANLEAYCKNLCRRKGADESIKRGAEAVLNELNRRSDSAVLLRASRGDSADELLRPVSGDRRGETAGELVRAYEEKGVQR